MHDMPGSDRARSSEAAGADRRDPLNLLILGGILLIAAIAIGTSLTIFNFRQRALPNSARELQNTVLLLARHFDRDLGNFDAVQKDLMRRMQVDRHRHARSVQGQMSGEDGQCSCFKPSSAVRSTPPGSTSSMPMAN